MLHAEIMARQKAFEDLKELYYEPNLERFMYDTYGQIFHIDNLLFRTGSDIDSILDKYKEWKAKGESKLWQSM